MGLCVAIDLWWDAFMDGLNCCFRFKSYLLFSLPFIWLIFEWSKSWVLTGFPWLDIGYSQTPSWLFSLAPVGGVYLVSFVVLAISASLAGLVKCLKDKEKNYYYSLFNILLLMVISFTLTYADWSKPIGQPLEVGVVQPNTPIEEKWNGEYLRPLITKLASLSKQLREEKGAELIVWPETALPLNVQQTDLSFWSSVTPPGSEILAGMMDSPNASDRSEIYNAALLTCDGEEPTVYRKQHLVPFGEYLPLRFIFNWVLEYLQLPMSDLSSWSSAQTLDCGESIKIGKMHGSVIPLLHTNENKWLKCERQNLRAHWFGVQTLVRHYLLILKANYLLKPSSLKSL